MPKPKKQAKQTPRRRPVPWLAVAAGAAVLLAVGLYGARAWWAPSEEVEPEFAQPKLGQPPPPRPVDTHDDDIARAGWSAPPEAPVVGVGAAGGPAEATLPVRDGRADVSIRVPRARGDGAAFTAYSLDVRSGDRRLWGNRLPVAEAQGQKPEAIALSFNAGLLRSIGADREPLTVVVSASAHGKFGEALGMIRLTLEETP
jgi:hypothetical protein